MPTTGATPGLRLDRFPVGFSAGWVPERETMLGSKGQNRTLADDRIGPAQTPDGPLQYPLAAFRV